MKCGLSVILLMSAGFLQAQDFKPIKPREFKDFQNIAKVNLFRQLKSNTPTNQEGNTTDQPNQSYVLVGVVERGPESIAYIRDKKKGGVIKLVKGVTNSHNITLLKIVTGRINQDTKIIAEENGREFEISPEIASIPPTPPIPPINQSASSKKIKFNYTALDSKGKETQGSLSATDEADAVKKLRKSGLYPTQVTAEEKTQEPIR